MGAERIRVADLGIKYIDRALAVRPDYREAMGFMSLLYRQKAFGYLNAPEELRKEISFIGSDNVS